MDHALRTLSEQIAEWIGTRNSAALGAVLAPGFVQRSVGGASADAETFLANVAQIPGDITFVRLEALHVDESPTGALVTGIQHARLVIDGKTIDDRRCFVDWFVKIDGEWRLQAAADVPSEPI